ncbi:MAG: amidohydrolase family protein [Deltaproteobacteria bacterium]|nr:amidohydrolase family protein [Deltaproteobacteria bacterium]MBW2296359.1 amidohydrolase family protein [Deltaproteobacteria bacterium]
MAIVIKGGSVFTGDGKVLDPAAVIIEGDRIAKIGLPDMTFPRDAEVIDIAGRMLLPGFVDCHLHILIDGSPNPMAAVENNSMEMTLLLATAHARDTLMAGVTTARDMGGTGRAEIAIRDAINAGVIQGPRLLVSGQQICMTGGQGWQFGREADGPDEVRKAAREQIKAGCDIVKLMATGGIMTLGVEPGAAQLTEAELRAGVEEAHRANRKCASHAQGTLGILNSLNAGVDSIEHGFFLNEACIARMLENDVPLIPTLGPGDMLEKAAGLGVPEFIIEKSRQVRGPHIESLAMAKQANVLIGMGADCGTPLLSHGSNLIELVSLVENGFTPEEALVVGTLNGARILGLDDRLGSIEEGKLADLVVAVGNPLDDISLLTHPENITHVLQGGRVVKAP